MEPTDLNQIPSEDSKLESLLREVSGPSLADDGFTARVIAALPPRRPDFNSWLQPVFCGLGAAIGLVVALAMGGSWAGLVGTADQLSRGGSDLFANSWLIFALAGSVAVCAAAYFWCEVAAD